MVSRIPGYDTIVFAPQDDGEATETDDDDTEAEVDEEGNELYEHDLTDVDAEMEKLRWAERQDAAPCHWYALQPYDSMSALGSGGVKLMRHGGGAAAAARPSSPGSKCAFSATKSPPTPSQIRPIRALRCVWCQG